MNGDSGPGPVATVVITTHNRPEPARRAVASALAQTLRDIEVVVVDDGSDPPFSAPIDDPRLQVVRREPPGGMCAARNHGLELARGAWVTFLDDDDEIAPQMLEHALTAAEHSTLPRPVAVMASMAIVAADGVEIEVSHPPTFRRGEHYLLEGRGDLRAKNALVMPTELVRAIGGWDEQFEAFEADDFGIRLNLAASILGLEEPLYRMSQHGDPRLTRRGAVIPRDMERTVVKHRALFRRHRVATSHYMSTIGMYDLKAGRWGSAVVWCFGGLLRNPRVLRRWGYFAAAVAGPHALAAYRRVRPREANVSTWVLTKRRARKYLRRASNHPRAWVGAPSAAVTRMLVRRRVPPPSGSRSRSVLVCCVYRAANAANVAALIDSAGAGWDVRLWALDRTTASLAPRTVGHGPGDKFPLLNQIVRDDDLERFDWVVVADDDVAFRHGSLDELLDVAEAARLDLVQPAHTELSYREHEITVRRPLVVARRTTFVEIGPVFAVRRPWTARVLPFSSDHTMGWGLELDWHDLEGQGARLGVIDAVPVRHLHPVGRGYAKGAQRERLSALLQARGLSSLGDIQRTRGTWRPWRSTPPWG